LLKRLYKFYIRQLGYDPSWIAPPDLKLWPKPGGLARNGRVPVGGASSANLQAPSQPDGSAQYYSHRTTTEPLTRGIPNV
jgi:hypothetical protein